MKDAGVVGSIAEVVFFLSYCAMQEIVRERLEKQMKRI